MDDRTEFTNELTLLAARVAHRALLLSDKYGHNPSPAFLGTMLNERLKLADSFYSATDNEAVLQNAIEATALELLYLYATSKLVS